MLRILGVDPGLRVTGYGLIRIKGDSRFPGEIELVEAGVVRTGARDGIGARLRKIYGALSDVIEELRPDILAIEKLYAHYKHPSTAILMGHARGAVCLLAGMHGLKTVNIASTHVKKAVAGNGHAGKWQIQKMVGHLLGLKRVPEPADVADALAVAIAYSQSLKGRK